MTAIFGQFGDAPSSFLVAAAARDVVAIRSSMALETSWSGFRSCNSRPDLYNRNRGQFGTVLSEPVSIGGRRDFTLMCARPKL